jgi:hypothetical protein
MVKYICDKCKKEFANICSFQEHISSEKSCDIYINKKYKCDNCENCFTTQRSKKNHMLTSCKNKLDANKLKEQLEEAKQTIKNLEHQIKRKPGRPKKININTLGNNNTINTTTADTINNIGKQEINQQFFIVEYGNEDISELTLDEKKSILHSKYDAIRKCAEIMHCNPNHPELRNIAITNLRSNTGLIFKNGKFRIRTKDGMLEDLIRDKANNVQDILDEGGIIISKATRDKLTHLLELVNDNDAEQMKNLKQELEFLLYEENKTIH